MSPLVWMTAILLFAGQLGCVQRRMTIRSNPPGAVVYVDNYEIGTTPVATDFVYYGTRRIRLVKDGYETLTVLQPMPAPWYQVPPLDFFSENLNPNEVRDERVLDYQLQPQVIVPTEQLLGRAEGLRRGNQSPVNAAGGVAPVGPAGPVIQPEYPPGQRTLGPPGY